jgi:hypothetical protein
MLKGVNNLQMFHYLACQSSIKDNYFLFLNAHYEILR